MYEVYGAVRSRAFRVLWFLEEAGVPYQFINAGPRSPEATKLNPSGKVPVLREGDFTLTDSTAILTYLADKHDALTFAAGTQDRARQDAITQFALDELEGPLWLAARHSFVLPEDKRVPEIKDSLKWEFAIAQERLAAHLGEGPFLMGSTMTIADIVVTHCGNWAVGAKFPLSQKPIRDYLERMRARPAFQRASAA